MIRVHLVLEALICVLTDQIHTDRQADEPIHARYNRCCRVQTGPA